jgi:hypothetical protein
MIIRLSVERTRSMKPLLLASVLSLFGSPALGQVERIWLTHRTNGPNRIVVGWTTKAASESVVRFGMTKYGREARVAGTRTLHHVEIPLDERDTTYHYSVGSGDQISPDATFKAYPTDELRVAVIANWHARPDLSAVLKDDVHLLMTGGDNISSLWQRCGERNKDCVIPYEDLIDAYPDLFRSTPFMPVLGNHDREIRPRGDRPPAEPVYDVDATAFRQFFELPDDEWKWHFDVPEFGVRFIALDFNHISDLGTTWQTCHDFGKDSDQFRWYEKLMADRPPGFIVTLYNEKNSSIRNQAKGGWHELFRKGTACITGFGHFAERAEVDGLLYFNTSLNGKGDKYPDPKSKALFSENNYVLLTFKREPRTMTVELKSLDGTVIDRRELHGLDR